MVTTTRTASRLMIIARPNRSASWRTNQLVLLALAVPSLVIATGFTLLGAWPILPLAGLELLAVGSALYHVNWKLQYRHVITLSDDSVCIDKGFYAPLQSWTFTRQGIRLAISTEKHPWESPELSVHDNKESVSLGEFLNRDDCLQLIDLLKQEMRVGTDGRRTLREF